MNDVNLLVLLYLKTTGAGLSKHRELQQKIKNIAGRNKVYFSGLNPGTVYRREREVHVRADILRMKEIWCNAKSNLLRMTSSIQIKTATTIRKKITCNISASHGIKTIPKASVFFMNSSTSSTAAIIWYVP